MDNPEKIMVDGNQLNDLPKDLFIPPDAMEVYLEHFSGPLDLLLYLIKKQNLDILNIPIIEITNQYMQYIKLMEVIKLELVGDYLVMAAILAEIKSRMLLPKSVNYLDEVEPEDPRLELIRRLQTYERYQASAEYLRQLPMLGEDFFAANIDHHSELDKATIDGVNQAAWLKALLAAQQRVQRRQIEAKHHLVNQEPLSVKQCMEQILDKLSLSEDNGSSYELFSLVLIEHGKMAVAVTVLAVLELAKNRLLAIEQATCYSPIYLQIV